MSRAVRFAPLLLVGAVLGIFLWRLGSPGDDTVRSRLIGQALPSFTLPQALTDKPALDSAAFTTGSPRLLNIFASWCVPCIAEAPVLEELRRRGARIDGIAIRDRSDDVAIFLRQHGDPYDRIGSDVASRVQMALGSSGVPETFVIDGQGVIRFQHVGPIGFGEVDMILSELDKAR